MLPGDEPLQIIGNESNTVYEIEPGASHPVPPKPADSKSESTDDLEANHPAANIQMSNDLATNDGAVVETLDTAFHHKPGVAEGLNPSGSDRADYYEAQREGKSDSEEEADALSNS